MLKMALKRLRFAHLLSICLGGLSTWACFLTFPDWLNDPAGGVWKVFWAALSVIFFTLLFEIILFRFAFVRLSRFWKSNIAAAAWLGLMLLAGVGLAFVLPVHAPAFYEPGDTQLKIITTGHKNSLSKGSQVSLIRVITPEGRALPMDHFSWTGERLKYEYKIVPFTRAPQTFRLTFLTHDKAGIAKVIFNDQSQSVDLYSVYPWLKMVIVAPPSLQKPVPNFIYIILVGIFFGCGLFIASSVLIVRPRQPAQFSSSMQRPRWFYLLLALLMVAVWVLFLLAFWPGIATEDTIAQWNQFSWGKFNDYNPIFHTLTLWLLAGVGQSPAAVALFQILCLASVVVWGISSLERWTGRLPLAAIIIFVVIFALSPANMAMVNTLWKDILYSISLLALSIMILCIILSKGAWLDNTGAAAALGVAASLAALYRHNGAPVAILTLVLLLIILRQRRRALLLSLAVCLVVWFGLRPVVLNVLHVPSSTSQSRSLLLFHIAAHLNAGTPLDDTERNILDEIRPTQDNWTYTCYLINPAVSDSMNPQALNRYQNEIIRIFWNTLRRDPWVNFRHLFCQSSLIWSISTPPSGYVNLLAVGDFVNEPLYVFNNPYFKANSLLPGLQNQLYYDYLAVTSNGGVPSWLVTLLWKPAVYLYLLIFVVAVFAIRLRNWHGMLFALPAILQSGILFLVNPAQDFRYQYPVYLIGLFSVLLLFIRQPDSATSKPNDLGD